MLLATRCPVCHAPGSVPCRACDAELRPPLEPVPVIEGIDHLTALLAYEGVGRELVARLKYRDGRAAVAPLGAAMAGAVPAAVVCAIEVVTWVPASPAHRRERGFDHGQLLARVVAARLQRPCRALLARPPGPSQTGRSRADRLSGPRLESRRRARRWAGVLVVDDVVTTGGSLRAAGRVLRGHHRSADRAQVAAADDEQVIAAVVAAQTPR